MNTHKSKTIIAVAALFLLATMRASVPFAQPALNDAVALSYLPQALVAASRGNSDVPVEVEIIFRETRGVGARLDQLKRSFEIPGVTTLDAPVSFINQTLDPGMETHQKITLTIPVSVMNLCLGGAAQCDLTVKNVYTGVDAQGASIAASLDIPIKLNSMAAAETFAVGDVVVTAPAEGQKIDAIKTRATAKISVTGIGGVAGQWLLNGKSFASFSKDVNGEGAATVELPLPSGLKGANTLQLRVTQPVVKESKVVNFQINAKPAGDVSRFRAGLFDIVNVVSKPAADGVARTGEGTAKLEALGLEIPVKFESLDIIDNEGKAELAGGNIIAEVDKTLDRGPLKITITQLLITADGAWIDGSAALEPSGMTTGIGPLFFYALPLNEKGIDAKTRLETPQKGKQGDYEVSVDKFELRFHPADAALKVRGLISKSSNPDWKMPLAISVSFGDMEP